MTFWIWLASNLREGQVQLALANPATGNLFARMPVWVGARASALEDMRYRRK